MEKISSENGLYEVSLKLILKNGKGEVLALKMPESSTSMPGYYDLPGGRIRKNETALPFHRIIGREIREELGTRARIKIDEVPVAIGRHYYFSKIRKKDQYIFWILFEAKYLGGEIRISDEHAKYEWLRVNKKNLRHFFIRGPLEGMEHYLYRKFPDRGIKEK